jgi:hypothetical protein
VRNVTAHQSIYPDEGQQHGSLPLRKLTIDDLQLIEALLDAGLEHAVIARKFELTEPQLMRVLETEPFIAISAPRSPRLCVPLTGNSTESRKGFTAVRRVAGRWLKALTQDTTGRCWHAEGRRHD